MTGTLVRSSDVDAELVEKFSISKILPKSQQSEGVETVPNFRGGRKLSVYLFRGGGWGGGGHTESPVPKSIRTRSLKVR